MLRKLRTLAAFALAVAFFVLILNDHGEHLDALKLTNQTGVRGNSKQAVTNATNTISSASGELGRPVLVNKETLNASERRRYDEGWRRHVFNQYVSDMISTRRSMVDMRDPLCHRLRWHDPLPRASVVIVFHNEAWSALLRTIHSVLDRSDPKLIEELIVVDDFSDDLELLGAPLAEYLAKLSKVRLVRLPKREGLIRARILGANAATADVLVFLDSHCETTPGWLEPLLDPIARNANTTTVPIIEPIDHDTFSVYNTPIDALELGGFDWDLAFYWLTVSEADARRRVNKTDPVRSPIMAGGLFAISRGYFQWLGSFDPGMEIWGGENLEVSFKIWMCGGQLVCAPCSHVGHVYRTSSPYKTTTSSLAAATNGTASDSDIVYLLYNSIRLAEVWLDEYKALFYERVHYDARGDHTINVSDRVALRQKLQCKSFDWYLTNVYPDLEVPARSLHYGEIRSHSGPLCVESNDSPPRSHTLVAGSCHGLGDNQFWVLNRRGEIRRDEQCWTYDNKQLRVVTCHNQQQTAGNQWWSFATPPHLKHSSSGLCLELTSNNKGHHVLTMAECDESKSGQLWLWGRAPQD